MEAQRRNNGVDGVAVAQQVKAAAESGGVGGMNTYQFQTMPPHYFPPQQYQPAPGQFPGYPMYPPMMPYPQMYGYHQYPPHMMNINMNMPCQPYTMPPAFANPTSTPPTTTSANDSPNKVEAKDVGRSAPADNKTLDETSSLSVRPTVSTETSSTDDTGSDSPSDIQQPAAVMKSKTGNSHICLQGSTSVESEPKTALLKQASNPPPGYNVEAKNSDALKEKHITVNEQEDLLPLSSNKKQEPKKEEVIEESQKVTKAHPHEDDSTTRPNHATPEKEEKSEVMLDDIDSLTVQCADAKRKDQEGIESLLLLSKVAENMTPSEDRSNDNSIHKPSNKRKLQLPMRADRKEGPLPKRVPPPPPQRTPAFFHFLLYNKESIEQGIFSDDDTSYGLERSEQVATEGAKLWLNLTEDEKQRWADVSTQIYLGVLSNS